MKTIRDRLVEKAGLPPIGAAYGKTSLRRGSAVRGALELALTEHPELTSVTAYACAKRRHLTEGYQHIILDSSCGIMSWHRPMVTLTRGN